MSSLTDLNNYSNNSLIFTENRSGNVIFDYPKARDITQTINNLVSPLQTLINIVEIVNPQLANIIFEIDVSAVNGTTVQWSSLPSGVSVVNGSVYTIYGIDSVSDWDAILEGNIVLPPTFVGSFFYTCTIYYTVNGVRQTQTWQVGNYLPEALLSNNTSLVCSAERSRGIDAELLIIADIRQVLYDAQLVNRFTLDVTSINFNFMAATTINTEATVDLFQPLSNLSNKTYQSNVTNLIFENDSPYVRDPNPGSSTFDVTLTVSNGVLSADNGATTNNTLTITGTLSSVNNILPDLIYYPDYNQTNTVNLTYSIEKDNVLLDSGFVTIAHTTEGTLPTQVYTFNSSDTFNAPYEQIEYGQWEYLIVAGGGGGAAGGGGAGGQVLTGTGVTLTNTSYPISVGSGGARGDYSFSTIASWSENAGQGANSTALGFTAYGGFGGRSSVNSPSTSTTNWNFNGGDTRKTNNTTQAGGPGAPVPVYVSNKNEQAYSLGAGGGGAGAGQEGSNAILVGYYNNDTDIPIYNGGDGGNGVSSSISGVTRYYGGGGGGGGGFLGNEGLSDLGQGGLGGGGRAGGQTDLYPAENGLDNYGGGGGGGTNDWVFGPDAWKAPGRGGKGIVILKVTPKT